MGITKGGEGSDGTPKGPGAAGGAVSAWGVGLPEAAADLVWGES